MGRTSNSKQKTNSKAKSGSTKVPIGLSHLVTGFAKIENGKIVPVPGTLETLRNRIFFVKNSKNKIDKFISNKKGVVNGLRPNGLRSNKFEFRSFLSKQNLKKEIFLAPPEVMKITWLAHKTNWTETITKFLENEKLGVELNVIPLKIGDFRKPNSKSIDLDEKQYAEWYEGFKKTKKHKHTGILFTKARAAFLLFNVSDKINKVYITYPDSSKKKGEVKEINISTSNGVTFGVLAGTNEELPADNYKIEVKFKSVDDKWSSTLKKIKSYTIIEPIRFDIHNLAGEFDIINCDPITLEESMIRQFPVMLSHIPQMLKKESETVKAGNLGKPFPSVKNEGIIQYGKSMHWSLDKANMLLGAVNESSYARMSQFTLLISSVLTTKYPELAEAEKTLKLVFGTYDTAKKWQKFLYPSYKILRGSSDFIKVNSFMKTHSASMFYKTKWMEYIGDAYRDTNKIPQDVLDITKLKSKAEIEQMLKVLPESGSNLKKYLGKVGDNINKKLPYFGVALSVIDIGLKISNTFVLQDKLDENKKNIKRLFTEYDEVMKGATNKECFDLLEKYRAATGSGLLAISEESAELESKAFDLALSVLALTPTPAAIVANAILLIKATGQIVSDLYNAGGDALDALWFEGEIKEAKKIKKLQTGLINGSTANQALMPTVDELYDEYNSSSARAQKLEIQVGGKPKIFNVKVGPNYYHVQYRIRAEALYGLMALIIKASIKLDKYDEASFKKKCDDYKVNDYIKYFILDNNWCFDVSIGGRIKLDDWWLNNRSPHAKFYDNAPTITDRYAISVSVRNLLNSDTSQMSARPIANFQEHFPIHKYSSEDLFSFTKYFTPVDIIGDTDDWIEQTYIYSRGKEAKLDTDWKLINEHGETDIDYLRKLSPFDQIRVLIVLKEKYDGNAFPDGIFPVNLQLFRTDGSNCSGPVYRNMISILSDNMLLENTYEFGYMGGKRKGVVFYPFYEFGDQVFFGIKPLMNSWIKRFGGSSVTDMRYAFAVKIGKTNEDSEWVALGAQDKNNKLDEIRMGIDLNDKEEKKLNIHTFLYSHSEKYHLPKLFSDPKVFAYYVKIGNQQFKIINGINETCEINDYNWNDKVEIFVLMYSLALDKSQYTGVDWKRIPGNTTLCNSDDGKDAKGLDHATTFYYLGELEKKSRWVWRYFSANLRKKDRSPFLLKSQFGEFLNEFDGNQDQQIEMYKSMQNENRNFSGLPDHLYLYVAKLEMKYEGPDKKIVNGLRPISSQKNLPKFGDSKNGHYKYTLRNFSTGGESGLSETRIFRKDTNNGIPYSYVELTLKVNAPKSYTNNVPWQGLSEAQRKEWIGKFNAGDHVK